MIHGQINLNKIRLQAAKKPYVAWPTDKIFIE